MTSRWSNNASDALYDFTCTTCSDDGKNTEAVFHCTDCQIFYCRKCVTGHNRFTKNHKVVDNTSKMFGQSQGQTGCFSSSELPTDLCKEHHGEVIKMFCSKHDLVCCTVCIAVKHRSCEGVEYLPKIAKGLMKSLDKDKTITRMEKVKDDLHNLNTTMLNELKELDNERDDTIKDIQKFYKRLMNRVEELGKKSIQEVHGKHKDIANELKVDSSKIIDMLNDIKKRLDKLNNSKDYPAAQTFVDIKFGEKKVSDAYACIQKSTARKVETLEFTLNKNVESYLREVQSLATTEMTRNGTAIAATTDESRIKRGLRVFKRAKGRSGVSMFSSEATATSERPIQFKARPSPGLGCNTVTSSAATVLPVTRGWFGCDGLHAVPVSVDTSTANLGVAFSSIKTQDDSLLANGSGFGISSSSGQATTAQTPRFSFASLPSVKTMSTTGFTFASTNNSTSSTVDIPIYEKATPVTSVQLGISTTTYASAVDTSSTASAAAFGSAGIPGSSFAFGLKPSTSSIASLLEMNAANSTKSLFAASVSSSHILGSTQPENSRAAFSFGASKTTASASQFSFNTSTTSFPARNTSFQTPASAQTLAPSFGTTSSNSVFVPGSQTSVFGFKGLSPTFELASNTLDFGSTNSASAFKTAGQTTAFGTTSQMPAFKLANQTPTCSSALPTFCAATSRKSITPVFGDTSNHSLKSVFGSTGNTGTGFVKSHSTPMFAAHQDRSSNAAMPVGKQSTVPPQKTVRPSLTLTENLIKPVCVVSKEQNVESQTGSDHMVTTKEPESKIYCTSCGERLRVIDCINPCNILCKRCSGQFDPLSNI